MSSFAQAGIRFTQAGARFARAGARHASTATGTISKNVSPTLVGAVYNSQVHKFRDVKIADITRLSLNHPSLSWDVFDRALAPFDSDTKLSDIIDEITTRSSEDIAQALNFEQILKIVVIALTAIPDALVTRLNAAPNVSPLSVIENYTKDLFNKSTETLVKPALRRIITVLLSAFFYNVVREKLNPNTQQEAKDGSKESQNKLVLEAIANFLAGGAETFFRVIVRHMNALEQKQKFGEMFKNPLPKNYFITASYAALPRALYLSLCHNYMLLTGFSKEEAIVHLAPITVILSSFLDKLIDIGSKGESLTFKDFKAVSDELLKVTTSPRVALVLFATMLREMGFVFALIAVGANNSARPEKEP